ncbi:MAG: DNA repair protein RadA [Patescibacteria group bacterium]|jgi:DNA repair protein RadA/Sms
MKKSSTQFVCSQCGYESVQWYGKCPNCGEWNTMVEFRDSTKFKNQNSKIKIEEVRPIKLSEIKTQTNTRISSKISELDRVLGGGFVVGEMTLLAGEPGIGKSTLLLELTKNLPQALYVCGEESAEQVKMRAERLGIKGDNLTLLAETNVDSFIESLEDHKFIIIDSIQTLWSADFEGSPGSISQVRGCSQKLLELAKKNGITMVLVGHVNKDGNIAGPMTLSHMVDAVFFLEGERFTDLRLLRGMKNRFGPTDEVGIFRMTEKGMEEVKNPSELFLEEGEKTGSEPGCVTICTMEGTRPMLLEIQSLVTQSSLAIPRRVTSGVDNNKVVLLAAVLQKALGLPLYNQDIFVKVGGGFRVSEPAVDLGICLAIVSSLKDKALPVKTCVFGEVGLLGEIRRVSGEEKREKEAKKLGFTNIFSSKILKNLRDTQKFFK